MDGIVLVFCFTVHSPKYWVVCQVKGQRQSNLITQKDACQFMDIKGDITKNEVIGV